MPPLQGDEEVKKGKRLKILALLKLSTRPPILLVWIKTGNNLYKLNLSFQHDKITKKVYNNLIIIIMEKNMVVK